MKAHSFWPVLPRFRGRAAQRALQELLMAHADALVSGAPDRQAVLAAYDEETRAQAAELLALAERIQDTMSEVAPSEQFVRQLGAQLATAPTVVPSRSLWGRVRHLPPRVQLAAGIGGATLTAGVVLLLSRTLVPGALESWRNRRAVTA